MQSRLSLDMGTNAGQTGRPTVVVSGQDAPSLYCMATLLREQGLEVVIHLGREGLRGVVGELRPQLIIIVDNWPLGPSVDLPSLRRVSGAAVIAVGSSCEEETMSQVLYAGADYYVVRPFRNAEFLARVRALLRRQGRLGQRRGSPSASGDSALCGPLGSVH